MIMRVGIEAINLYGGSAYVEVRTIFEGRGLDLERFDNLMMKRKAMVLPCEDPVTNAVNAAKPIIDRLSEADRNSIELVITATESGLDFGKSLSTYVHEYLGLSRSCRLFEIKQACYGGTAALHMAASFVMSQVSPGAKALVISTDSARPTERMSYAEPSQAEGALAMLISDQPHIMELDFGANGYYSYEVMDACRPRPEMETGNPDLTLLSYLDCLENSFKAYAERVEGADFHETFDYLAFHTPFGGMVKGAHRKMMRQLYRAGAAEIAADFERRIEPSLAYCVEIGNVYSATVYMALCGLIDHAEIDTVKRVGFYSYGSGCSSEFYSGTISPYAKQVLQEMRIKQHLDRRYPLTMAEYEHLLDLNQEWKFGIQNKVVDLSSCMHIYERVFEGQNRLVLTEIKDYHRKYEWT
jgi:polyketide biosynthesis 3-hydroxy-3-methylglutaryl-CoA synthase-like enzyme PksG